METSVTVLNNEVGVSNYFWQFMDIPENSHAVLTTPTQSISTFTPDVEGTYLIRLINGGAVYSQAGATPC